VTTGCSVATQQLKGGGSYALSASLEVFARNVLPLDAEIRTTMKFSRFLATNRLYGDSLRIIYYSRVLDCIIVEDKNLGRGKVTQIRPDR